MDNSNLMSLKAWYEVTKGLYRYVIASNCSYEIHILKIVDKQDVLTATASLYLVGDWFCKEHFFSREPLLIDKSVQECLEEAALHYAATLD